MLHLPKRRSSHIQARKKEKDPTPGQRRWAGLQLVKYISRRKPDTENGKVFKKVKKHETDTTRTSGGYHADIWRTIAKFIAAKKPSCPHAQFEIRDRFRTVGFVRMI